MSLTILNKIKDLESYSGVCNVIQSASLDDIVLLPCRSQDQQDDLLKKHLPQNFNGMLVSPFPSNSLTGKHLLLEIEEIKKLEIELIDHFYPRAELPVLFGVTGTNGKTSVAWLVSEVLNALGKTTLYMGTPGVYISGEKQKEEVLTTTPSYLDIRKALFKNKGKIDALSLELSSHALSQSRLADLKFDVVAWTNFSQDHLDFHKTMDDYFKAKSKIVEVSKKRELIVPRSQVELQNRLKERVEIETTIDLGEEILAKPFQKGFSKENLEVAYTMVAKAFPMSRPIDFKKITLPPGRMQVLENKGVTFVVDYAHTPDALEKALNNLKEAYEGFKIFTVFGCGGDRDKTKRPLMAKAASKVSDHIFVTSDNPRTEDPEEIIKDILPGLSTDFSIISDRKKAIETSFQEADSTTVVLIAGKGHEAYQEIDGVRHPFDDAEIVRSLK